MSAVETSNQESNIEETESSTKSAMENTAHEISTQIQSTEVHANVVADHYNRLEHKDIKTRFNSPIFYLRNFNNWIKSVLIHNYSNEVRNQPRNSSLRALDICCGKGGDLRKWEKASAQHVTFADIADVSIENCKSRYDSFRYKKFKAEFIVADCTRETLRSKYRDPSLHFDIVSCQFGLHYSFESLVQARQMLKNISDCLRADGYFIGTIPDANKIVARARKSPSNSFGNRIYNIKLLFDPKASGYPLFGAKYDFNLEGVVDCPEFLVNFELLVKLASEFGLELVYKSTIEDFYKEHSKIHENVLRKVIAFECYPPAPGQQLLADVTEYEHAEEFHKELEKEGVQDQLGTMSASEWEVASMNFSIKIN